ncbi:NACHT domain-containing protein [Isoptericola aurantiacus]|uniref:NACHT domain-containing protein n=1 Tax=Isoptericola aurantiacus TaxID=3377839 RepID=UPI00383B81F8
MTDYDLTRLGTTEFERMAQALAAHRLGAHVKVYGAGRDGGRELTYEGPIPTPSGPVTAYLVLQAKYRARTQGTGADGNWFLAQVRQELGGWRERKKDHTMRIPEHLLFVTNVVLTPVHQAGTRDKFDKLVKEYADLGIKRCDVWAYDDVCTQLDNAVDVRQNYLGYLLTGDVLARLVDLLGEAVTDLAETLTEHATMRLTSENRLRLTEAGDQADSRALRLSQVVVDVPAFVSGNAILDHVKAFAYILAHGDMVLRPSLRPPGQPHLLVIGGPGHGKTTIGLFLSQVYRAVMLGDGERLTGKAAEVRDETLARLRKLGIPAPRLNRWPVRVDLAEYADEISGGQDIGLLRWLASQISKHLADTITPRALKDWLRRWPWLLILDGLDEVASATARDELMDRLGDFLEEAHTVDADLLVIATTRPQGYGDEFRANDFAKVALHDFEPPQAVEYAGDLARARHEDDIELREAVVRRVQAAADESVTARLMRTPLQVTIMSLLLEGRQRPPQDRHGLFEAYFLTIYKRETGKSGPLARLLEQHAADVRAIHEQAGFLLQVLSEQDGDAEASLPEQQLRRVVLDRLASEGNIGADAERLCEQILRATRDRLVMLVPRGAGQRVGFEVRSLQEYMAARALVRGSDQQVVERLRVAAPSSHWRNVWLLATGAVFRDREHLRSEILSTMRALDLSDLLAQLVPEGPRLATALLDDDVAASAPRFRSLLVQHALEALRCAPLDTSQLARVLVDADNDETRPLTIRALESSLVADPSSRATASRVAIAMSQHVGPLPVRARQLRSRLDPDAVDPVPVKGESLDLTTLGSVLPRDAATKAPVVELLKTFATVVAIRYGESGALHRVAGGHIRDEAQRLDDVVRDPSARDDLALVIDSIDPKDWSTRSLMLRLAANARGRIPAGPELVALNAPP